MQIKNNPSTVAPSTTRSTSVESTSTVVRQPGTTTSQPLSSRYASGFESAPKQPNRLVQESAFQAMVEVLPPETDAQGRPTDADLEWALNAAFTNKYIVGRQPSAEEKQEWMKVASQLREKGKSADDIRQTLVGQMNDAKGRAQDPNKVLPLPTRADGRVTDEDLEWALKEAFTNKYVVGRPPTSNEFSRWMEVARKLREKGKSADDIRQTLVGQMSQAKDRAEGR